MATSTYCLERCTAADIPDMATAHMTAMERDAIYKCVLGSTPRDIEFNFQKTTYATRFGKEGEGVCEVWKVVDGNGKMCAWSGINVPNPSMPPSKHGSTYNFPPECNEKAFTWMKNDFLPILPKYGFDPMIHFQRQNIVTLPTHQHRGLATMLTNHFNSLADAAGATTYARAFYKGATVFVQKGYEVLARVDVDLNEFGWEGFEGEEKVNGKTSFWVMKREPGAENKRGRKLEDLWEEADCYPVV